MKHLCVGTITSQAKILQVVYNSCRWRQRTNRSVGIFADWIDEGVKN